MKHIFTADIHLQDFPTDTKIDSDGISLKLKELISTFDSVCNYALKNNISDIFIGGDINHKKNIISAKSIILFKEVLFRYTNITFHIIKGNHDIISSNYDKSVIDLFRNIPNVILYDKASVCEKYKNISLVPHSNTLGEDIKKLPKNDILISHLPLSDARTDSGLMIKTDFSMKDFKKFKLVLLGDYHTPQSVEHIHYPGTLIPLTIAEVDEKGFIVFDDETLKIERIPTTGYRKYYNVVLDENSDFKKELENIRKYINNGDYVTVRQKTKTIPQEFISFSDDIHIDNQYEEEEIDRGITSAMDIKEQMKKYVDISAVDKELHQKYLNIGTEVLFK